MFIKEIIILIIMRTFVGGEIKPECHGDLAVVVTELNHRYHAIVCQINSDEFVKLTDIKDARKMPYRVYVGVSESAADKVCETASSTHVTRGLESIDDIIVKSYSLNMNRGGPERIVLKKTDTGYKITEGD